VVLAEFPGLLLWGLPGLIVWAGRQLIAGFGLGLAIAAVAHGVWLVVPVALILGWPSLILFRSAR
jgi:hypothetical protein